MSDRAREMLEWVEQEMYERLSDPDQRAKISPNTLVRMREVLARSVSPESKPTEDVDPVEMVRALGLPYGRQVALLAKKLGVTSEEAATLLADTEGNTDGRQARHEDEAGLDGPATD